jgi:hypothetical protein
MTNTTDGVSVLEHYRATDLLQGSANYRTWKFSMRMTLLAKDLWEVVGGEGKSNECDGSRDALLEFAA